MNFDMKALHASAAFLRALREREKEGGIQPDPDVDAFLKASAVEGMRASPVTQFITRILGLEARPSCALRTLRTSFMGFQALHACCNDASKRGGCFFQ